MTIAILATGDELTHGDTLNTTSQALASTLSSSGFPMGMHLVCGDKEQELFDAIEFLARHHEVLIITGGLGPTSDDRTRFALANYLKIPLVKDLDALRHIAERIHEANLRKNLGLEMGAGQETQALFPEGAIIFDNVHGTARGCAYAHDEKIFLLLPGPPRECLPMFEGEALSYLKQKLTPSEKVCLKWQLFGLPEGTMAEKLEKALTDIPCQVGYRLDREASKPYLEFKVRCSQSWVSRVHEVIDPLARAYASD